jgi:hypothetical protein
MLRLLAVLVLAFLLGPALAQSPTCTNPDEAKYPNRSFSRRSAEWRGKLFPGWHHDDEGSAAG